MVSEKFPFYDIVKKHRAMVFKIAYGYTKDTHDADDIAQEVFLKLYKHQEDFDKFSQFANDESLKAWLIRVTINQSKSLLKTFWNRRRTDLEESMAAEFMPEESLRLYRYVDGLKPKYRTVIYLYYYEGYSVKEIAGIMKIKVTTVTTQLNRARNQLKEKLLAEGYI